MEIIFGSLKIMDIFFLFKNFRNYSNAFKISISYIFAKWKIIKVIYYKNSSITIYIFLTIQKNFQIDKFEPKILFNIMIQLIYI